MTTLRQAMIRLGWRYIDGSWPNMVFASPGNNYVAFTDQQDLQAIEPLENLSSLAQRQVLAGTGRAVEHPTVRAFIKAHQR